MALAIGIIGIIALILGLLHLFSPRTIHKLDGFGRGVFITMDQLVDRHRIKLGIFYLIAAAISIYVGFFLKGAHF